jgi:hypothetical protein
MRIDRIGSSVEGGVRRISARISWEDCGREPYELFIETEPEFAGQLNPDPHAFLIAAIVPAMHFGERRIAIDEAICPEILDGSRKVMEVLSFWNRDKGMRPCDIETRGHCSPEPEPNVRSAFFYSGGIDSFAALRSNRLNFSPEHRRYIRDGILIYGIEQDDRKTFEYLRQGSLDVAREADFTLLPVRTNMYMVFKEEDARTGYDFWNLEYGGAALASVAHAFGSRVQDVTIAGNCDPVNLWPWGTHPMIDHHFGNCRMTIRHDAISLSRLQKVRLVAGWTLALNNIRVCNQARKYSREMFNCGQCEKCIRTMLELQAVGKLEECSAFPTRHVDAGLVATRARVRNDFIRSFYSDVIPHFREQGRDDIVEAIQVAIRKYDTRHSLWRRRVEQLRCRMDRLVTSLAKRQGKPEQCV